MSTNRPDTASATVKSTTDTKNSTAVAEAKKAPTQRKRIQDDEPIVRFPSRRVWPD